MVRGTNCYKHSTIKSRVICPLAKGFRCFTLTLRTAILFLKLDEFGGRYGETCDNLMDSSLAENYGLFQLAVVGVGDQVSVSEAIRCVAFVFVNEKAVL